MSAVVTHVMPQETLPNIRPRAQSAVTGAPVAILADGATDVGCVRERNEDQFLIADLTRAMWIRSCGVDGFRPHMVASPQAMLLAVADGLGGHGGGDLASAVALDALTNYVSFALPWLTDDGGDTTAFERTLELAVHHCQEQVVAAAARKGLTETKPGTTLTMAYIVGQTMFVVHAGDSRGYLLRDGALTRLTSDHTLAEEMARACGTSAAETNPQFHHVLSNAVGAGQEKLRADVSRVALSKGDVLLLCTDGLTGHLTDGELRLALSAEGDPTEASAALIEAAKARGGSDNVTAIVARVDD